MANATTGGGGYEGVALSYDRWIDEDPDEVLMGLIGQVSGQDVLSLACGQGRDARMIASRGGRVVGVDASQTLIDRAIEKQGGQSRPITYLLDDAQLLSRLEDASFHGVVCHMALMDIPDLPATLSAVRRVLRVGGWLVLSIKHPCFTPPSAGELLDHADGSSRRVVGDYFAEGEVAAPRRNHDALPGTTHHRMLSTYINELAR